MPTERDLARDLFPDWPSEELDLQAADLEDALSELVASLSEEEASDLQQDVLWALRDGTSYRQRGRWLVPTSQSDSVQALKLLLKLDCLSSDWRNNARWALARLTEPPRWTSRRELPFRARPARSLAQRRSRPRARASSSRRRLVRVRSSSSGDDPDEPDDDLGRVPRGRLGVRRAA